MRHNIKLCAAIIWFTMFVVPLSATIPKKSLFLSGYIDRLDPPIILIEETKEELQYYPNALPPGSEEGVWVDLMKIGKNYYVVKVNQEKTTSAKLRTETLHQEMRNQLFR